MACAEEQGRMILQETRLEHAITLFLVEPAYD